MTKLRDLREKAFLSQRELGKLAKVHYITVARIETGQIPKPRYSTIRKLAKALKCKPGDLTFGESSKKKGFLNNFLNR